MEPVLGPLNSSSSAHIFIVGPTLHILAKIAYRFCIHHIFPTCPSLLFLITGVIKFGEGDKLLFVPLSTSSSPALGPAQSRIQWVPGSVSLEVKRQGREAGHSFPSSAEVKNGGATPPLPQMSSWHSACLIKHRNNFSYPDGLGPLTYPHSESV
jgi:hypothetical protein